MNPERVILFDGVCNLCNSAVQFIIRHDPSGKFMFASLQGATGQQLLTKYHLPLDDFHSFVYIEDQRALLKSTGALRVCRSLSFPANLLYGFIIVPRFIRDAVYDLIAKKRYRLFGRQNECMVPTPDLKKRFLN